METCKRCECRLQKNVKQKLLTKTTLRGYCLLNGIRFYKSTIPLITFSVSRKYVCLKYLFLNKTKHLSLNFQRSNWLCRCGEKEKEAHITSGSCPIYDDIWEKRGDLENNDDLVKFFSAVLERRDLLDRLEEEDRDAPSLGDWDS